MHVRCEWGHLTARKCQLDAMFDFFEEKTKMQSNVDQEESCDQPPANAKSFVPMVLPPEIKERARDLAFNQSEYEYAMLLAAELCEDDPEGAAPLVSFRSIYARFINTENIVRINNFHDSVGIEFPTFPRLDEALQPLMSTAEIDVIIPIHNALDHVEVCLFSLLEQKDDIKNIILVDDGSSGPTKEFLLNVASKHCQVTVLRSDTQRGFTEALTLGLAASNAPLFVALNSDTVPVKGWLTKLLDVYNRTANVGIVGPLSNSAAWQNLGDPFSPSGNFQKHDLPIAKAIAQINEELSRSKLEGHPSSPLIHGFCALVNRQAFEFVGGLDRVNFPRGYGEFQDLSLRMWDAGFQLRIACDCYVGHVGFASIDPNIRSDLSKLARATLYEKHSALRYLVAEAAAAFSPPMTAIRARFSGS